MWALGGAVAVLIEVVVGTDVAVEVAVRVGVTLEVGLGVEAASTGAHQSAPSSAAHTIASNARRIQFDLIPCSASRYAPMCDERRCDGESRANARARAAPW